MLCTTRASGPSGANRSRQSTRQAARSQLPPNLMGGLGWGPTDPLRLNGEDKAWNPPSSFPGLPPAAAGALRLLRVRDSPPPVLPPATARAADQHPWCLSPPTSLPSPQATKGATQGSGGTTQGSRGTAQGIRGATQGSRGTTQGTRGTAQGARVHPPLQRPRASRTGRIQVGGDRTCALRRRTCCSHDPSSVPSTPPTHVTAAPVVRQNCAVLKRLHKFGCARIVVT